MASLLLTPLAAAAQPVPVAIGQCAAELGLTPAECSCTLDHARTRLSEQQIAYLLVRVARDEAEVARMRPLIPFGQRMQILLVVSRGFEICAPDKHVALPQS